MKGWRQLSWSTGIHCNRFVELNKTYSDKWLSPADKGKRAASGGDCVCSGQKRQEGSYQAGTVAQAQWQIDVWSFLQRQLWGWLWRIMQSGKSPFHCWLPWCSQQCELEEWVVNSKILCEWPNDHIQNDFSRGGCILKVKLHFGNSREKLIIWTSGLQSITYHYSQYGRLMLMLLLQIMAKLNLLSFPAASWVKWLCLTINTYHLNLKGGSAEIIGFFTHEIDFYAASKILIWRQINARDVLSKLAMA